MSEATSSFSTPARALRPLNQRQRRALAETALERALDAVQAVLEVLDTIDGDPDLEPSLGSLGATFHTGSDQRLTHHGADDDREEVCEDEGGACEDEGADNGDAEPDQHHMCNWQDEGDQTTLRQLPVCSKRRRVNSPHQNVGEFVAVRVL